MFIYKDQDISGKYIAYCFENCIVKKYYSGVYKGITVYEYR